MRIFGRGHGLAALLACVFSGGAAFGATSFSFTGSFSTDDQLAEIPFSLASTATITIITFGYAGGTNQAAAVIPQGGFDPYLAIFNSSGNLVQQNDNGTCGQVGTDAVTNSCFDSFISQPLAAGLYTLILSQSPNVPVSNQLSDGYTLSGTPDFTGSFYGCSNGMFCDANADNRTPQHRPFRLHGDRQRWWSDKLSGIAAIRFFYSAARYYSRPSIERDAAIICEPDRNAGLGQYLLRIGIVDGVHGDGVGVPHAVGFGGGVRSCDDGQFLYRRGCHRSGEKLAEWDAE